MRAAAKFRVLGFRGEDKRTFGTVARMGFTGAKEPILICGPSGLKGRSSTVVPAAVWADCLPCLNSLFRLEEVAETALKPLLLDLGRCAEIGGQEQDAEAGIDGGEGGVLGMEAVLEIED
jgi:hypothetical protein